MMTKAATEEMDVQQLISCYREMVRIREFEDTVQQSFLKGLVHGSTHLCQGQEAGIVGTIASLRADDYITYTYRGHGVCVARGMDLRRALSEIFGRTSGVCGGYGGSMHLTDPTLGLIGSFGIVGAGLPVAVGAGLSCAFKGNGAVSVTFFGDGAVNIGEFHESLNLASIWKLPVLFLCENNLYAEFSRVNHTTAVEDLYLRGAAYAMKSCAVDGNDIEAVFSTVQEAVNRARENKGPSFIELKTYRYMGHSRTDPGKYRLEGELEAWLKRDPIDICKNRLIERGIMNEDELEKINEAARQEVLTAFNTAQEDEWPEPLHIHEKIFEETIVE